MMTKKVEEEKKNIKQKTKSRRRIRKRISMRR
jgi:hypothetical protein